MGGIDRARFFGYILSLEGSLRQRAALVFIRTMNS